MKRLSLIVFASIILAGYQNCARPKTTYTVLNSLSNLIFNAGFERGTLGYNHLPPINGTVEAIPSAAHAGALGLRLYKSVVEPETLPTLKQNKVYLLSFWARAVTLDQASATERFPYAQVDTGFVSMTVPGAYQPETTNRIKITSTTWQKYEYVIEPGSLAGHFWKLALTLNSSDGSNNVVDFDELALEEVGVAL